MQELENQTLKIKIIPKPEKIHCIKKDWKSQDHAVREKTWMSPLVIKSRMMSDI